MPKNITQNIIRFLSLKSISIAVIFIAIVSRVLQLIFFFNIRVDGMYQYLGMKYFVAGHGVSIAEVLPENLSEPIYEPLINWPPGYSILLSPLYILFNKNYIAAGLTLDILAAVALIFFTRKVLKSLSIPVYLINIFTLFCGFFIYNFYLIASSDAIAISFFVIAIYQLILLLKSESKWILKSIGLALLLTLCGFIKYLFYPVVFILPIFLITKGFLDKRPLLKKAGYLSVLFLTITLGSLLIYQKAVSGSAGYISQPERGFFPENLSNAYPFLPASFINPESITRALGSLKAVESSIFRVFQFLQVFILIIICIICTRYIIKKGIHNLSLINSFYASSILITLAILGLLSILSLTVAKEEINPGVMWSYIEDARYHGLITILLQISLFVAIHQITIFQKRNLKFITLLFFILLLPEAVRGVLFDVNRIRNLQTEKYSWQQELAIQKYANSIIKNKEKEQSPLHTAVTGSSYYTNYRVCIFSNAFYLKNTSAIYNAEQIKSDSTVLLLVILETQKLKEEKTILQNEQFQSEGDFSGYSFFSKVIKKKK